MHRTPFTLRENLDHTTFNAVRLTSSKYGDKTSPDVVENLRFFVFLFFFYLVACNGDVNVGDGYDCYKD